MAFRARTPGRLSAATVVAVLAAAVAQPVHASGSCAWAFRLDPVVFNTAFPDQAANYWMLVLPAVPGETLTITGEYPHARYMSFTAYNPALQAVDGLNDTRIDPDTGSANPFPANADRTVTSRRYKVTVELGTRTADVHNVLYQPGLNGAPAAQFIVIYRVFRADASTGTDGLGGVPLPTVTANVPGGESVEIPTCDYPSAPPNDVNDRFANAGGSGSNASHYPGEDPPRWHKFYNTPTSYVYGVFEQERLRPTGLDDTIPSTLAPYTMSAVPPGGFLNNPDNAYISAITSGGHGPFLELHGKLPSTPDTYDGQTVMGAGQLRYWSLCTNEPLSQRFYACLADDQVKIDADRFYTVVISTTANKPPGIENCAATNWLPSGPLSTVLIMRNMLPDNFPNSIQAAGYGSEAADMGDYYPGGTYQTSFSC